MPELPEVETIVRDLRRSLPGQSIVGVNVCWERAIAQPSPAAFRAGLLGQRIEAVDRRGKFVIIHLSQGALLVHLRMTGQLLVAPAGSTAGCQHLRVVLDLSGGCLLFNDARKFGRMGLVPDTQGALCALGPEPLDDAFGAKELAAALRGRRVRIKTLLLDQRFLAGLGNIYADEALYAAGIAPQRLACTLDSTEAQALHSAIRNVLQQAIEHRGTTFSSFRDAQGDRGTHRDSLRAYGRGGQACPRCGSVIARARLGGRSCFHCPHCQQ